MDLRQTLIGTAAIFTIAAPASAVQAWLSPDEITEALAGKTLEGRYASGKAFTERYHADGRVEYIENGGFTTSGHWSVTAGSFCTIYVGDASGGCFRVGRVGRNCFEFYFITRTEDEAAKRDNENPSWTARGSVSSEKTACPDAADV